MPRTKKDLNQDKRLLSIEKKVKELQTDEELKYKDTIFTTPATNAGTFDVLNGISQGVTQITRLGAMIHMTSVQWRFAATALTATLTPTRFRYMIVLDRQANGTTPTYSGDPLTATQIAILNSSIITQGVQMPIQYETIKRFRVLKDKTIMFNPQMSLQDANPATAVVAVTKEIRGYMKLNVNTKYGDDVATASGINTNSLWFVTFSDIANGVTISGGARVYYKDA